MNNKESDPHLRIDNIEESIKLLTSDRAKEYGHVVTNFKNIKDISNIMLKRKGIKLDIEDIAIILVALKIAREGNKHSKDNISDGISYLQILDIMNNYINSKEE